jgi:hypothetical protein
MQAQVSGQSCGQAALFDRAQRPRRHRRPPVELQEPGRRLRARPLQGQHRAAHRGRRVRLFGYIGTPTSLAALPLATAGTHALHRPFTGAQALREPFNRYAFHVRASYFDETAAIVKQITSVGMKRVASSTRTTATARPGWTAWCVRSSRSKLEPAGLGTVERNTVDVDEAVKAILCRKPDAIVQISAYKSCAAFIAGRAQGRLRRHLLQRQLRRHQALADELGADGRGVVVSQVMPYPLLAHHGVGRLPGALKRRRRQVRAQLQQHRRLRGGQA